MFYEAIDAMVASFVILQARKNEDHEGSRDHVFLSHEPVSSMLTDFFTPWKESIEVRPLVSETEDVAMA